MLQMRTLRGDFETMMMLLYVKYMKLLHFPPGVTRVGNLYFVGEAKRDVNVEKCSNNYRSLIKKLISSFMLLIMILILLLFPARQDGKRLSTVVCQKDER
jgi:hypothetical protein